MASVLLVSVGLVCGAILAPSRAEAAAAQCFKLLGNPARPTSVPCSQLIGLPLPAPLSGPAGANSFIDGQCYLVGWGMFTGPAGGPDCRAWQNGRVRPAGDDSAGGSTLTPGDGSLEDPARQSDCDGGECVNDNYLVQIAKWAINILSAVVGVVVVGVIVFAGIQYSSSAGDPNRVAAAKGRIINAIIALVAFMFLYVALQWLIPGGLFA